MNALRIILLTLIFTAFQAHAGDDRNLSVTQTNHAAGEQRIALVIGNSAYTGSPLKNPVNDARDMAVKLRELGFDVIERTNLQTKQIGATLREFRSKLVPGSVALVFYAGHGLQIKGINYLPAVDADINSEEDVPNQSLAVNQIMDVLEESRTRLNLVFLDACRNNPYARSFRSADQGLARVTAPSGTLISYATRPGSIAADGSGRNGLYTGKLLALMDSNMQIEQSLKRLVTEVKHASHGKQEPWMEGSIEGDFCFAGCISNGVQQMTATIPAPVHVKSRDEIEQETWENIQNSGNIGAIEEFIEQYPKGRFIGSAKVLLSKLNASPANAAAPVTTYPNRENEEAALWEAVEKGNSADDYDAYLMQYPNGRYAILAKSRKARLKQAQMEKQQEIDAWVVAEQSNSKEGYGEYLKVYPVGQYAALARERQTKLIQDDAIRNIGNNGAKVLGQWGDGLWYPGTITGKSGNGIDVAFDDGDKANLPAAKVRPVDWSVGSRVQCNWKGLGRYYSGTITAKYDGLGVHISYDDGDQENTTISKCRSH